MVIFLEPNKAAQYSDGSHMRCGMGSFPLPYTSTYYCTCTAQGMQVSLFTLTINGCLISSQCMRYLSITYRLELVGSLGWAKQVYVPYKFDSPLTATVSPDGDRYLQSQSDELPLRVGKRARYTLTPCPPNLWR